MNTPEYISLLKLASTLSPLGNSYTLCPLLTKDIELSPAKAEKL